MAFVENIERLLPSSDSTRSLSAIEVGSILKMIAIMHPMKNKKERSFIPETLEKLVFIAHGFYLALRNEGLIFDSVIIDKKGPYIDGFSQWAKQKKVDHVDCSQEKYEFLEMIFKIFVLDYKFPCERLNYLTIGFKDDWERIFEFAKRKREMVLPSEVIKKRFADDVALSMLTSYDLNAFEKAVA